MTRSRRAPRATSSMRPASRATWSRAGACRIRSVRSNMPRPRARASSAIRRAGRCSMSNQTAQLIDDEIKTIVEGGLNRAKDLLTKHLDQLHLLAGALLEYETLIGRRDQEADRGRGYRPDRQRPEGAIGSRRRHLDPQDAAAQGAVRHPGTAGRVERPPPQGGPVKGRLWLSASSRSAASRSACGDIGPEASPRCRPPCRCRAAPE